MDQYSFSKYKRTLSFILCLTYILQFPIFGILHYFIKSSTDNEWVFLVSFGGLNILLIFLLNFFHIGMPKTLLDICPITIFLLMSGCYFYTLYYRVYWMTIVMNILITIASLALRYTWTQKFSSIYCEDTEYLKEESTIRFSIYVLPTIVMDFICNHIENVIPNTCFSILVRLLYFVIAFGLIATTYFLWYGNIEKIISYKQLILEIMWLLVLFLIFIVKIQHFNNTVLALILPICGIIPILIRHKNT